MNFPRNVFYPIRLILYPACLVVMMMASAVVLIETVWTLIGFASLALLTEAIWEFGTPYVRWNRNVLMIHSSIVHSTRIDLSKFTADDIEFETWFVNIGPHNISLRRMSSSYRKRFEEEIEMYFELDKSPAKEPHT